MPAAPSATAFAILSVFPVWEWYTISILAIGALHLIHFMAYLAAVSNPKLGSEEEQKSGKKEKIAVTCPRLRSS
jgi:uncharacterized protein YpmS